MKSSLSELQNNDFPSLWASNAGELSSVSGNQKSTAAATESAELQLLFGKLPDLVLSRNNKTERK